MIVRLLTYSLMMFAHLHGHNVELHVQRNHALPVITRSAR